ncbi:hypothetical protein ABZU78_29320 [Rhodococcus erythropolis]|uniref:hypothetical protein n=1 Tax=Rhodococcus erythropolis TaxID=1833 RepID=UPI0033BA8ABA
MSDTSSLIAGAEQYVASLTDNEFADLVSRTREEAPKTKAKVEGVTGRARGNAEADNRFGKK